MNDSLPARCDTGLNYERKTKDLTTHRDEKLGSSNCRYDVAACGCRRPAIPSSWLMCFVDVSLDSDPLHSIFDVWKCDVCTV